MCLNVGYFLAILKVKSSFYVTKSKKRKEKKKKLTSNMMLLALNLQIIYIPSLVFYLLIYFFVFTREHADFSR